MHAPVPAGGRVPPLGRASRRDRRRRAAAARDVPGAQRRAGGRVLRERRLPRLHPHQRRVSVVGSRGKRPRQRGRPDPGDALGGLPLSGELDRAGIALSVEILLQRRRELRSGARGEFEQRHRGAEFHVVR